MNIGIKEFILIFLYSPFAYFSFMQHFLPYLFRNELADITAIAENIPDNGGAEGSIFGCAQKKYGFNDRGNGFVHQPDGPFKLKIGGGPQPAQDVYCIHPGAKIDSKT